MPTYPVMFSRKVTLLLDAPSEVAARAAARRTKAYQDFDFWLGDDWSYSVGEAVDCPAEYVIDAEGGMMQFREEAAEEAAERKTP